MNGEHDANGPVRPRWWDLRQLLLLVIDVGLVGLVLWTRPLARLGLEEFETRHGSWPEFVFAGVLLVLVRWAYLRYIGLEQHRAGWAAALQEMRTNPPKRMSLLGRSMGLLIALALVIAGSLIPGHDGRAVLIIGVPMFLLFVLVELNILLRPGDTVLPDPHDELMNFFKARTLQVGYFTAIVSLAALYVIGLFQARYVEMLLPVVLAISLLVPAFAYRRLDRRASTDG